MGRFARCTLLVSLVTASSAFAQDEDAIARARELGEEGSRAYERGEWEVARSLFHRARDLYAAPTLGVREAHALVKLGKLVEAERIYEHVSTTPIDTSDTNADLDTFRAAQATARVELTQLRPRIPRLELRVDGAFDRVAIALDGKPVPLTFVGSEHEIDPGLHTIAASWNGESPAPTTVTFAEGEKRSVLLTAPANVSPEPDRARSGRDQRIAGFVGMGLSAVGIGLGVGLGVAATSKHDELDAVCSAGVCPPSSASTLDQFHALRDASTVSYVVGGVLAAAGLAIVLTAPSSKATRAAWLTPFGVSGAF
jgi:hypothetical protein